MWPLGGASRHLRACEGSHSTPRGCVRLARVASELEPHDHFRSHAWSQTRVSSPTPDPRYAPGVPRVFRHRLRIRYGECDPQGVVFNANYLAFFDVVITEFWREAIGEYNAMIEAGADMVVAESRIRFLGPAAFDEELDFELRVSRLGNTALGTLIDAGVGDRPVVAGEMRHVFIDPATKLKRQMPDDIRTALEPYAIADQEPARQ
jgi:acyl-CoA thioester hydrolase